MVVDDGYQSVPEFLRAHPYLGKNLVYQQIREGRIPHIKVGSKILVPTNVLERLADQQAQDRSEGMPGLTDLKKHDAP